MSKPLELTVYPKRLVDSGFHRVEADGSFSALRVEEWLIDGVWVRGPFRTHKRLTDAELAAEHWRAKYSGVMAEKHGGLSDENRAKIKTVERFYLAPHYDEEATA